MGDTLRDKIYEIGENAQSSFSVKQELLSIEQIGLAQPFLAKKSTPKKVSLDNQPEINADDATENDDSADQSTRVLPSVRAFTAQCSSCMKWRLIPTKEQYEDIRQSILEKPFYCSSTSTWRPGASCENPPDLSQDASHVWAIDKPNIPVAPKGWERLLVIRAAGASKFADVYYITPSGRKLRSMPEVERFLAEHPEHFAGISLSQFSFLIPRPLDKGYLKKKSTPLEMRGNLLGKRPQTDTKARSKLRPFRASCSKEGSEQVLEVVQVGCNEHESSLAAGVDNSLIEL